MRPDVLFSLAALLAVAAGVCMLLPWHPVFNQPIGHAVLGGISLLCLIAAIALRARESDRELHEPESTDETPTCRRQ
jgi:hypothetical protein